MASACLVAPRCSAGHPPHALARRNTPRRTLLDFVNDDAIARLQGSGQRIVGQLHAEHARAAEAVARCAAEVEALVGVAAVRPEVNVNVGARGLGASLVGDLAGSEISVGGSPGGAGKAGGRPFADKSLAELREAADAALGDLDTLALAVAGHLDRVRHTAPPGPALAARRTQENSDRVVAAHTEQMRVQEAVAEVSRRAAAATAARDSAATAAERLGAIALPALAMSLAEMSGAESRVDELARELISTVLDELASLATWYSHFHGAFRAFPEERERRQAQAAADLAAAEQASRELAQRYEAEQERRAAFDREHGAYLPDTMARGSEPLYLFQVVAVPFVAEEGEAEPAEEAPGAARALFTDSTPSSGEL